MQQVNGGAQDAAMAAREQVEAALRQERQFSAEIIDSLPGIFYVVDEQGRLARWNRRFATVSGYSDAELAGRDLLQLCDPETAPRLRQGLEEAFRQGEAEVRARLLTRDGRAIPHRFTGRRTTLAGKACLVGLGIDISGRQEIEARLRDSEERFRLIADNIPQLAWMADEHGSVFWNNQRCFDYTGLAPEELLGHGWMRICHPDHLERVMASARRCIEKGEPYEEAFPVRGADGRYRWFLSRAVPERDPAGRVLRWFGSNTDITERKVAEAARRRAETRLQRLYDANLVGIVISDEQGFAIEANDRFLQILDRSREEVAAGTLNWRDITPPEWAHCVQRAFVELGETGLCTPFEKEYFLPDGSRRWVNFTAATLPEEPGKIIAVVQDISPRKRVEQEIESLNAALERRVEERTAALLAANRALEGFTFATSHDLKGPLGRINSFGALLEQQYRDRLEGNGLLYLEFIRQNSTRLNQLVDDLLQHARIAQQNLELRPVDVLTRVLVVLEESVEDIREAKAEVRLDVPPVRVLADPQALTQALSNLFQNALKYSARTASPAIEIGGRADGGRFLLWVRDNGIGFDMAYHDKIFEIFSRLHTYNEYEGSGVGLALVKRAMERMGGRVWADSQPGQGATFYLEFHALAEPGPARGN